MRTQEQQERIAAYQKTQARAMGEIHSREGGYLSDSEDVIITRRPGRRRKIERRPARRLRERLASWLKRWFE